MKKLLSTACLLMLVCGSINAKFYPAVVVKQDGSKMEGFVSYPIKTYAKAITYKADANSKSQDIKSVEIRTIRFQDDNDVWELDYYPIISMRHLYRGKAKHSKPAWLLVIMRGQVTLYLAMSNATYGNSTGGHMTMTTTHYLCKRESEPAASHLSLGNERVYPDPFPKIGSTYFVDNPSMAEKIKNKEEGYRYNNIVEIVREYNLGATKKK